MMGWTVRDVAEVIGLGAVVASLVFVGLEVRQNSVAIRATSNAAVADGFRELNLVMASSPDLMTALIAVGENPGQASKEEQALALSFWRALFHTWSNAHRQWKNETLDEALYESIVSEISAYSSGLNGQEQSTDFEGRGRAMRWAWEREKPIFNPEFQVFLDGIVYGEGDAE